MKSDRNPKVSTGDVPLHAIRYAFGLKPYKGKETLVLDPKYDSEGQPRHPYSGKIYVSVHPLTDYDEQTGASHLVSLQNLQRINLIKVIIPERETQFEGMIEENRVKWHTKAKFPNFSKDYKSVYLNKYGLDEGLFKAFKGAITSTECNSQERVYVEALLSHYLVMHNELLAVEEADKAAKELDAVLVYRTGLHSFDFTPPDIIRKAKEKKKFKTKQPSRERLEVKLPHVIPSKKDIHMPEEIKTIYFEINLDKNLIPISGDNCACYIRSLVTALHILGYVTDIESIVSVIEDHLEKSGLRQKGEMIDMGDAVGAEVLRVLQIFTNVNLGVRITQWDSEKFVTFDATAVGDITIDLFYTPGHFDLIAPPSIS